MDNTTAIMKRTMKDLWLNWDIRTFMMVSLLIQTLLTMLAPLRKRTSNTLLFFSLWFLYLCADAVALFTIGKISSDPGPKDPKREGIYAFWAPFLLLHLGGPDSITALALADNELWHRHALSLITQVLITIFVFTRSLGKNYFRLLWIPTLLMFIDGCVKYVERTCALYYASADIFRESLKPQPEAGPNYVRLVEEYSSAKSAHLPIKIHGTDGPSGGREGPSDNVENSEVAENNSTSNIKSGSGNEPSYNRDEDNPLTKLDDGDEYVKRVKFSYYFFNKFKGLLVDAILSLKDKEESRGYFLKKNPFELAKIVTTELHLMYDVSYTKVFLIDTKLHYARWLCLPSVISALLLFSIQDKKNYHEVDVTITFALLGGAVALDICGITMFLLSDWYIILTFMHNRNQILKRFMKWVFEWTNWARVPDCYRCDRSISRYNFLERCFKRPPAFVDYVRIKRIRNIFVGCVYTQTKPLENPLLVFVIKELQMKAEKATDKETVHQVCAARGNLVLQEDYFLISECLSPWTTEVDYDESLLIWHLATDICYRISENTIIGTPTTTADDNYREFSQKMSNYMLYLLLRQEGLMSPLVGISDIRFEDTCAEARKFSKDKYSYSWSEGICAKLARKLNSKDASSKDKQEYEYMEREMLKKFCNEVLEVKALLKPSVAKGDKSKSVLFDACRLAKLLMKFEEKQWEITSKVWVEMLGYAATRCSARAHLSRLNQGGELITLVWLSMAQLGLGERFRQDQGYGLTKLILED